MIDERTLAFPDAHVRSDRDIVMFTGMDGDRKIICAISREALEDHFQGNNKDMLKVYKANRERIEYEARRKYLAGRLELDGSVLIKTVDL